MTDVNDDGVRMLAEHWGTLGLEAFERDRAGATARSRLYLLVEAILDRRYHAAERASCEAFEKYWRFEDKAAAGQPAPVPIKGHYRRPEPVMTGSFDIGSESPGHVWLLPDLARFGGVQALGVVPKGFRTMRSVMPDGRRPG